MKPTIEWMLRLLNRLPGAEEFDISVTGRLESDGDILFEVRFDRANVTINYGGHMRILEQDRYPDQTVNRIGERLMEAINVKLAEPQEAANQ